MNAPRMIVQITTDELAALVREAVDAALAARHAANERPAAEWLDARAVAALLDVHVRSVQKMVRDQGLPAHRLGPKLLRYRRDEVERWIRERRG